MLDFAIIGLPRSGTTWAANWLTTDRSICLHDPLMNHTLDDLAVWDAGSKAKGVACTALWMFPEWLARNVRTVIYIDRDIEDVDQSLCDIGLGALPGDAVEAFQAMAGHRVQMDELFSPTCAAHIWEALLPSIPFDYDRHELLTGFMINPFFAGWEHDPRAVKDWLRRVQEAAAL